MENKKEKHIVPFTSITSKVKVRRISNESIARCDKTIEILLKANAKERTNLLN